jgi:outer membrane protein assembly factor BamB
MRIDHFPAGLGFAAVLLAAACGGPKLQPETASIVKFPLMEAARLSVKAPMVARLTGGPGGLILTASIAGELQALDPPAKAVRWTFSGGPSRIAPAVDGERIFWAAEDGKVYGLDAKGKTLWTRTLDEPVRGDLRIVGGRLVFREGDKALTALNTGDGEVAWRDPASLPEEWTSGEGRIVVRTEAGLLRVLDPDGRLIREIPAGETSAGSLGLYGNFVFLGYADGRFGALDLSTGKKKWSIRLGGIPVGPPATDGRIVFVVLSNHVLAALRAKRGDLLWWKPLSGRAAFPPRLHGDFVFVGSRSAVFQAFAAGDGTEETAFTAASEILAPAEEIGSKMYLMTSGETEDEGLVFALDFAPPKAPEKPKTPEAKK